MQTLTYDPFIEVEIFLRIQITPLVSSTHDTSLLINIYKAENYY